MKVIWPISFLSLFCFSSCLEDDEDTVTLEEYEYLQEDKVNLEDDLREAYQELDEFDEKFKVMEELEKKAATVEGLQEQIQQEQEAKKTLEEQMRKLRQNFEDYQKKYEAKVRAQGQGETFASIEVSGRTLKEVEISSVSETEVKVKHAAGFATLTKATAPPEWQKRFFLRSEKEVAQRAEELALFLNPPSEEEALEVTTQIARRPPSEYQLKREKREKETEELKTLDSKFGQAVVLISGNSSVGTGFFAQDGITTYLYTAAHVLDGNSQLKIEDSSGKEWQKFGNIEVAEGLDLVRLEVTEQVGKVLSLRKAGEVLEIGSAVAALGNAGGGGVITKELGTIRGVGAESYELSGNVLQGNSGKPVMNSKGEVLALVTHPLEARDNVWTKGRTSSRVRSFACRIDTNLNWKKTTLGNFLSAHQRMNDYDKVTRLLFALSGLNPSADGLRMDARVEGGATVSQIFEENKDLEVVKRLLEINTELGAKKMKMSERDLRKKFRSFYATVYQTSSKQSLDSAAFSPYHKERVKTSLKYRARARKLMAQALNHLKG